MRALGDWIKWFCCLLWGSLTDLCSSTPEPDPPESPPDPPLENESKERLGLALSGGGFRAAFFHLGVLARLAEAGILPRVQVISTVSGGSIIGTAYYLLVKNLLEEVPEEELRRADYVKLVEILEQRMRYAVRKGIRGRIYANPLKNLAMVWPWLPKGRRYSRTDRIGDLADRHLYKGIFWPKGKGLPRDDWWMPIPEWRREQQIELRNIRISPKGSKGLVNAEKFNGEPGREFMVPALAINATCLNTGHRWCFEATRMGEHVTVGESEDEPEIEAESEAEMVGALMNFADGNATLAPGRFLVKGESPVGPEGAPPVLPDRFQDFPLAHAVAASAAFPGAFPALPISGLYGTRIQLSDGGAADNQGIQTLIDHKASFLIASDGSGQMRDMPRAAGGAIAALARSGSIQGDRVRELQLKVPENPLKAIHLREGLVPNVVQPDSTSWEPVWPPSDEEVPDWPVHPRALDVISRIRTDLDWFSREEVDALAATGYLLTDRHLAEDEDLAALEAPGPEPRDWDFLNRQDQHGVTMRDRLATGDVQLIKRLGRSRSKFFRFLLPAVGFIKWALILVLAAWAFTWLWSNWQEAWDAVGDALPEGALWVLIAGAAFAAVYGILLTGLLRAYRWIRDRVTRNR